jgi:hypothetical protein
MSLSVKHLRDLFGDKIPTAQVLQGVATGMADCGVTVVIDPNTPYPYAVMEEKKIVLPSSVKSARALLIVSWHVDHEAGHLIYTPSLQPMIRDFVNNSKMKELCEERGYGGLPDKILEAAKFFHNLLEDARIEQLMVRKFPGSKKHFIGGPIAAGCDTLVVDTIEQAKDLAEERGQDKIPLSPFWVCEMHAHHLLGGTHGTRDRNYVRTQVPDHVEWACDVADDVFGDITDVCAMSSEELGRLTDEAMTRILDKVLPDLNAPQEDDEEQGEDGEGEGQQQPEDQSQGDSNGFSPFDDDFTPSDTPQESKYDDYRDDEEEDEDDDEFDHDDDDEPEDDDGEFDPFDEDEGSDEDQDPSGGSGEDDEEEQDSDSGGAGRDDEDDEDDEGDDPLDGDDCDDDEEDGSSESDGEDGDQCSGGGSGAGDTDETGGDDPAPGHSNGSSHGESSSGSEDADDEDAVGDSRGAGQEGQASDSTDKRNAALDQVMDWVDDAKVDMSELMREGGGLDEEGDPSDSPAAPGGGNSSGGASPVIEHAKDIMGMPDEYLDKLTPGCATHVIAGLDLNALIGESTIFTRYDNFIRTLMPSSLGPAARKLVGKFQGAPGKAWSGNRVNPRMLQPIKAGKAHGRPLYLRRNETVTSRHGVVVQLCIDCSGSMESHINGLMFQRQNEQWATKFAVAHAAARSIARLLQTIKVPFSVMGYTTKDIPGLGWGSYSRDYSRCFDIVNFLFKDFDDPWTSSEPQMIAMNQHTNITYKGQNIQPHTNSDGESLLWAASRIIAREEDRKVMIVLSDGLPYAGNPNLQSRFLKYAIRRIELAGIHIGGLGLGDEGVKHYYNTYELLSMFPPGHGTELTAPLYIQEKLLGLIDRLSE